MHEKNSKRNVYILNILLKLWSAIKNTYSLKYLCFVSSFDLKEKIRIN